MKSIIETHPSLKGKQCDCEDSYVEIACYDNFAVEGWIWSEDVQKHTIDKQKLLETLDKFDNLKELMSEEMYEDMKIKGWGREQATIMLKYTYDILINTVNKIKEELDLK